MYIHSPSFHFIIDYNGKQPANPLKAIIVDLAQGERQAARKPFRRGRALGTDCYNVAKNSFNQALERLEIWKGVTFSTDFRD
jgi:hypothetical protein